MDQFSDLPQGATVVKSAKSPAVYSDLPTGAEVVSHGVSAPTQAPGGQSIPAGSAAMTGLRGEFQAVPASDRDSALKIGYKLGPPEQQPDPTSGTPYESIAKFGRGGIDAVKSLAGLPGAVFHAFSDAPKTPEEDAVNTPSPVNPYGGRGGLAVKRLITDPMAAERAKAGPDLEQGHVSEAIGHSVAGSIPFIGPFAAHSGEAIGNDPLRGAGELATNLLIPKVVGEAVKAAAPKINPARAKLSNSIVGPLVKTPVSATLENSRFGRNPAQAITDEGLVGTREGVLKQADARVKQLSDAIDAKLQNHPNANAQIDAGPVIDSAIDNAVNAARKTGNAGIETRLEALRTALKTQYGKTTGTPFEINQLKRQVGEVGSDLGAFKSTDPLEASAASAMADVYGGLKRAVNQHVPDVVPLNERVSNLIAAKTALRRNIALDTNKSAISGGSLTNLPVKIIDKTLLSSPVRTGVARVVNAGNKLGIPPEVQNVISSQQFRAPDAPPLAPPNVPSADIPRPADFASNVQQTGETVLGGGKGVLRRPALLLGQGDVTTPPNAAGTVEHSYLNQRDAGVLPGGQGRVVPKLLGGAGPEGQKLLPESGGGSAIGLPEKSQSTLEGGRSYESPRAPLDEQLPALIRDFVEKRNPARLPDTVTNSPAKAADYQNQAALKLFGKPYEQLSVPERIRTLSEGAKLQDAVRAPKSEAQSFLDTLVGHNDSIIPEPVSRVTTPNGSGESAASQEALSRVASEQNQGIKRVRIDTRSGAETPLFGPDAVDAKAGPFDRIVQRDASGRETTLDSGQRARPEPRIFGTKDGKRVHIPKSQLKEALNEGFQPEGQ